MADNTEETKPAEGAESTESSEQSASEDPQAMTSDQSFTYWLVMLPFLGIASVFVYEFSKHPGETNRLINAAGAVIVGLLIASMVNVLVQSSEKAEGEQAAGENPKPEGSS